MSEIKKTLSRPEIIEICRRKGIFEVRWGGSNKLWRKCKQLCREKILIHVKVRPGCSYFMLHNPNNFKESLCQK
jgi:hypothetical protein